MRMVNLLFNIRCIGLKYSVAASGLIVLFFVSPLWGYIADYPQQQPFFSLPNDCAVLTRDNRWIRQLEGYLAKSGSSNQHFQQWQDLSPKEQEKMRKKYREWQSLPPQKRRHYKQLFRQWQHLPAQERKQLQEDLENWENLSPRQRELIRRRFKN